MNWAENLAKHQRMAERETKMPRQFRCESCNAVEYGAPHTHCNHCNDEFRLLRELADKLRKRLDIWHLSHFEIVRTAMNRLIAEINDLRKVKSK